MSNALNNAARRAGTNFFWLAVTEALAKGVFFLTNIILARRLGVSSFGLFSVAQMATFCFWLAVDLGVTMYGIREVAKAKDRAGEIINPLLTMRLAAGALVFLLYLGAVLFMDLDATNRLVLLGCGVYLVTYSIYADWIFKGLEEIKYIALGTGVSSLIFLAACLQLVRGPADVVRASFYWSISFLPGGLFLLYALYRKFGVRFRADFDLNVWKGHIGESVYFMISGGLLVLYQYIPVFFLAKFFSSYEVGLFSAPYRVMITVCSAGFMIPMAFYPVFADLYKKDPLRFRSTHRMFQAVMIFLGISAGVAGFFLGGPLVELLFGPEFREAAFIFKLLALLVPLYFLRFTYGSVLLAMGFQKATNNVVLAAVAVVTISGGLLIPEYGTVGAGAALVITETVFVILIRRVFKAKTLKIAGEERQEALQS